MLNKTRILTFVTMTALVGALAAGQNFDTDEYTNSAGRQSASAGGFALGWYTVDGGGGTSTGAGFVLRGTIGQPDAGTLSGGGFELRGGFRQALGSGCGDCLWDVFPIDGVVGAGDLAFLLGNWGPVSPGSACLDVDGDGIIGAFDLANLLGNWGPCP